MSAIFAHQQLTRLQIFNSRASFFVANRGVSLHHWQAHFVHVNANLLQRNMLFAAKTRLFAAKHLAICRKMRCVLPLNAVQFAANSTFFVVNCPPFCINTHLCTTKWFANIIQANANFSPKEPPRELNICHRMGNW